SFQALDDLIALAQSLPAQRPGKATGPKPGVNDDRDQWIYNELKKTGAERRPLETIRLELNKMAKAQKWEEMDSVQGLRQAAIRYAERKRLPPLPKRRSG